MSSGPKETRESILQATRELVVEHHDPTISMKRIAERAGISRQAVYLHFDSRTDLMLELVAWIDEIEGLSSYLEGVDEIEDPVDRMEAFIRAGVAYEREIAEIALVLDVAQHSDEAAAAAWEDRMSRRRASWGQLFEDVDEAGRLRSNWTPQRAAEASWSLTSPASYRQLVGTCDWEPDEYADWAIEVLRRVFVSKIRGGG